MSHTPSLLPSDTFRSYFLAYEWLVQRHMLQNRMKREEISPVWACTYGAAAGFALWGT